MDLPFALRSAAFCTLFAGAVDGFVLSAVSDGIMSDLSTVVTENQLAADMFSSGVLAGVGDAIAQKQQQRDEEEHNLLLSQTAAQLDWQRTQQFVLKGCGSGALWSNWFAVSDLWCTTLSTTFDAVPQGAIYIISSLCLEQFLWCPIVYSCWDLTFPALAKQTPYPEIQRQIRLKLGSLLWANAKVWTLVNLVVYSIPLEWRVILTTVVDLFWQSFVSKTVAEDASAKDPV